MQTGQILSYNGRTNDSTQRAHFIERAQFEYRAKIENVLPSQKCPISQLAELTMFTDAVDFCFSFWTLSHRFSFFVYPVSLTQRLNRYNITDDRKKIAERGWYGVDCVQRNVPKRSTIRTYFGVARGSAERTHSVLNIGIVTVHPDGNMQNFDLQKF